MFNLFLSLLLGGGGVELGTCPAPFFLQGADACMVTHPQALSGQQTNFDARIRGKKIYI